MFMKLNIFFISEKEIQRKKRKSYMSCFLARSSKGIAEDKKKNK